jgi:hypothetical protein
VLGVARVLQRRLARYYALEQAPCITEFMAIAKSGERETLLLRQTEDTIELRLVVPQCKLEDALVPSRLSDSYLQVVEGVSHFVFLCERIRTGLPTSHLELELQAEVDKLVLVSGAAGRAANNGTLHSQLYEQVRFLHSQDSETGSRYRMANSLAARFTKRLESLAPGPRR